MLSFKEFLKENALYQSHTNPQYIEAKHKELAKNYPASEYSPHQKKAIEYYVNGEDIHLTTKNIVKAHKANEPDLFKHLNPKLRNTAVHIRNAINQGPELKNTTHTYHGMSGTNYTRGVKPGDVLHTAAFTSTSIDLGHARSFTYSPNAKDKHDTILHFKLPAGSKHGMYISHMVQNHDTMAHSANEHEYLLNHNQKWKVHKVEKRTHKDHSGYEHTHRVIELHPHTEP